MTTPDKPAPTYRISKHTGKRLPSKRWLRARIEQVKQRLAEEITLREAQLREHLEVT